MYKLKMQTKKRNTRRLTRTSSYHHSLTCKLCSLSYLIDINIYLFYELGKINGNITGCCISKLSGQCECHSTLKKVKSLPQTFPLQNTPAVTSANFFNLSFCSQVVLFSSPPYPTHQSGGEKPSINEQIGIVIRLAVLGDRPFGNKRKSCLINGDINHGLARLAKRRSISCLIYRQDMRERGEGMTY